ncbi:hypothetical protein ACEWY4_021922 [Coilia grayii]|uniref:Uncharacterized protein n=1 Tax=Coilia grayii TaxID=363190 RepID=A0ABD1J5K7_9TELE
MLGHKDRYTVPLVFTTTTIIITRVMLGHKDRYTVPLVFTTTTIITIIVTRVMLGHKDRYTVPLVFTTTTIITVIVTRVMLGHKDRYTVPLVFTTTTTITVIVTRVMLGHKDRYTVPLVFTTTTIITVIVTRVMLGHKDRYTVPLVFTTTTIITVIVTRVMLGHKDRYTVPLVFTTTTTIITIIVTRVMLGHKDRYTVPLVFTTTTIIIIIVTRVMLGHKDRYTVPLVFTTTTIIIIIVTRVMLGHKDRYTVPLVFTTTIIIIIIVIIVIIILFLGMTRLQACVRGRRARLEYERRRSAAVTLQAQTRGLLSRRRFRRQRDAAIVLQTHARAMLARKTVKGLRTAERLAQEQTALELQRRLEEILNQSKADSSKAEPISDEKLVESVFDFLPSRAAEEHKDEAEASEEMAECQEEQEEDRKEEEEREEEGERSLVKQKSLKKAASVKKTDETEEETIEGESSLEQQKSLRKASSVKKKGEEEEEVILTFSAVDPVAEGEDDDEEFSFSRFCSLKFQGSATESHINLRLKQPLLSHEDEGDALACLSVWWIILRFMGDLPEPKAVVPTASPTDSIQRNLGKRQDRRLSNLVGLDQLETPSPSEPNVVTDGNDIMIGEGPTFHRPMTSLEKIHIIVGYALSRPAIRDEILCQICKQLTGNSSASSCKRGWVLMAICLGIFPPTQDLMRYLRNFIRRGPADYSSYCMERLHRTLANGAREELACWVELDACRSKKPVKVKVSLPDGRSLTLQVDSASTSLELCTAIAKATGLRDAYGFSLYMAMHDKMWSLGNKGEHLMDAIAQCEQEARRQGSEEQSAPWKLSFRKEIFAPWPSNPDPAATSLTYSQIISGLQSGEYQSDKEDDFVQLAAMHYFVKFGSDNSTDKAREVVKECIHTTLIENKSEHRWIQMLTTAHTQGSYIKSEKSTEVVKQEVVDYARRTWPMFFSRFFEITYKSGPPLSQERLILGINWSGLSFFETKEKMCLELPYAEITDIIISEAGPCPEVLVSTLRGDIILEAQKGEGLVEMVGGFLDGLRQRSTCAVALHDAYKQDDPDFLVYRRGDVLLLHRDEEFSQESGWLTATNERTGQSGAVSEDAVTILPTMIRPTDDTLNLLNLNPIQKKSKSKDEPAMDRVTLINLKEFSFEYFREPMKGVSRGAKKEKLWANSREPLKQPLLRSVAGNTQLSHLAYMGDYPIKQARSPLELTDQIFAPATQHPEHTELRDEIYCQIMKQLTNNNNSVSLERGWQLLWLCCGLFPPSEALLKHTLRFIESRPREPLSATCLQRLRAMLRFFQLRTNLHVVNNNERPSDNTDVFYKVRPLYDSIRKRCLELQMEENLSIDEQIVPFRGKLSVLQYVKGKPEPWGVKVYFLCGKSGLAYDFLIYQGATTELSDQSKKILGHGAAVVTHLCQRIQNPNHKLFFDNFFTTYNVLEVLSGKNIQAAGTARVCRFANPPLKADKEMSKKGRGSHDEVRSRDGKVVLVKWFDNRSVVLASNFVGVGEEDEIERWEQKAGEFVKIKRPEIVKLYNESMGGVDKFDQLISLYRTTIRSRKWSLRMITHAFDVAVVNSWLEYRRDQELQGTQPKQVMDLLQFKMAVAEALVRVGKTQSLKKRGRPSSSNKPSPCMSPTPQPPEEPPKRRAAMERRPIEEVQADMLDHMPNYDTKKEATRCKLPGCSGKTHVYCDKCKIFEVTTTTKICDLCRQIATGLRLHSADGYSIFVKTASRVVSLEEHHYFFDDLRQKTEVSKKDKKDKKPKEGVPLAAPYLVLFMRKLWFNVIPGKDVTADTYFHYPQEVPKYLRGYHRCSREDMISLAGLLFRVKVDSDRSQFVMIPRMLKDLVPADQMKLMSPEDWKKHIISAYNKQSGISVEEAKVNFLKHIAAWPTFGSVFFEVKQTSDRKLPSIIRIGINKQGVCIIDPKNKDQLAMHPFGQITNWSSGSTYFHLTLGNLVKGNTLLCETSLGYKMDDLLESYVQMYMSERQWNKPRNSIFPS